MYIDIDSIRQLEIDLAELHRILTNGNEVDTPLFRQHFESFKAKRKQMREALEMLKIEFNTTNDTLLKYDSDLTNNNFIIN